MYPLMMTPSMELLGDITKVKKTNRVITWQPETSQDPSMEVIYYSQQMAKVYSYKQMVVEDRVSIDTLYTFF